MVHTKSLTIILGEEKKVGIVLTGEIEKKMFFGPFI